MEVKGTLGNVGGNHSALSTGNIRHKHSQLGQLFIGVKQELERNRLDDILWEVGLGVGG